MTGAYEEIRAGDAIEGSAFAVTRETIREFCDASLDYNPLHLDDEYMKESFGKTQFGGIIMHGMTSFGLITRMLTDWLYQRGGVHRRLETRWRAPVRPGDTIRPRARVVHKKTTHKSRWLLLEIELRNQREDLIASGEAMAEFPQDLAAAVGG
ncbi:MAG TPA: MaoC family dehydratase [Burkholderiales bacterium]|nr:MaoC family dehydratase [Burkholderiales bacterium]